MNDLGRQHGQPDFSFPKSEKLTGKKDIEGLFKNGSSFYLHPLLMKYASATEAVGSHKLLFTVSKRNFKSAVKRNLIKRRMREAYRLNKHLLSDTGTFYHIGFVYLDKTILPYRTIEDKLKTLLLRLQKQTSPQNEK